MRNKQSLWARLVLTTTTIPRKLSSWRTPFITPPRPRTLSVSKEATRWMQVCDYLIARDRHFSLVSHYQCTVFRLLSPGTCEGDRKAKLAFWPRYPWTWVSRLQPQFLTLTGTRESCAQKAQQSQIRLYWGLLRFSTAKDSLNEAGIWKSMQNDDYQIVRETCRLFSTARERGPISMLTAEPPKIWEIIGLSTWTASRKRAQILPTFISPTENSVKIRFLLRVQRKPLVKFPAGLDTW